MTDHRRWPRRKVVSFLLSLAVELEDKERAEPLVREMLREERQKLPARVVS